MSRKTISKKFLQSTQKCPSFTRRTKRLCKKFTNKNAVFFSNILIFAFCKQNLPVLGVQTEEAVAFCALFCLFWHRKKSFFWYSKLHLPILKDSKKSFKKGEIRIFVRVAQFLRRNFYTLKSNEQIWTKTLFSPNLNTVSRNFDIFVKAAGRASLNASPKKARKGLSHLDAEGVIWFSSAYEDTPESQSATKKPHKTRKSAEKFGGFQP